MFCLFPSGCGQSTASNPNSADILLPPSGCADAIELEHLSRPLLALPGSPETQYPTDLDVSVE